MEILYGIVILMSFILGLGLGLIIPYFIKKYVKQLKEESKKIINNKTDENPSYYPKDLLDEWMTGEVKHEEQ